MKDTRVACSVEAVWGMAAVNFNLLLGIEKGRPFKPDAEMEAALNAQGFMEAECS